MSQIMKRALEGITSNQFIIGQKTRYYILTIKLDSQHYHVKVLDMHNEMAASNIEGTLDSAKKEGGRLLFQKNPSVSATDVTMVHYKDDRPNGRPWQKDKKVVKQLLAVQSKVSAQGINLTFLDETLKKYFINTGFGTNKTI